MTPPATAPAFRASHRYARMAPRKARLVADLIRGLPVNAALRALDRSDKRAASLLGKVVRSAVANAEQDGNVDPNHLVVKEARVDEGPLLGGFVRWKAGSRGRAMPIKKRTSHMYVALQPAGALARSRGESAPATDAPAAEARAKPARKAPAKPKAKTAPKGAAKAEGAPAKKTTKKKKDG
ncbi:MAG TPA: 50S ribosomal protein L22 [Planctomycetota bacterium]|nr:50S ribosomal protein L22 [Planctomycetota bacterium]